MINCQLCRHWDVFDSETIDHYTHERRVVHVETCKLGLSPVEDGKTASKFVEKCDEYERLR